MTKFISWIVSGVYLTYLYTLYPLKAQIKVILYNIASPIRFKYYTYSCFNGGFTILPIKSKDQIDKLFAIYQVPDKNIFVAYWRIWHKLNRFTIGFSFNEYCDCNKYELLKFRATISDYKNKHILNFNYKTNYE